MRVLFVTHCSPMAGANRSMIQLIVELRQSYGVEPFVLLPTDREKSGTVKYRLQENGILFKDVHVSSFKKPDKSAFSKWDVITSHRIIKQLAKELLPYKFDLVLSNSGIIDVGAFLSRELGVKHIWHLRDFGDLDYSLYCVFGQLYERLTYRNAEGYIAISQCIKNHFSNIIPHDKINVIYNGIMPESNVPLAKHDSPTIQFFCAGVYSETKNQMEILKAANVLVNEYHIINFHVTTVGWGINGNYAQRMIQFIKDHSLEDFVSILGELDGIAELASAMDVGIMPSRNEAFGRVTVEYMLQNLAVIANDSGANPEIIKHGNSGLIYNRTDFRSLANNMRKLINDHSVLVTLATGGYNRAHEMFLSSQNTKTVYDAFENVLLYRDFSPNSVSTFICRFILIYYEILLYVPIKLHALCVRLKIRKRFSKFKNLRRIVS